MTDRSTSLGGRHPHVVLDVASRRWKAQKIERLLGLEGAERQRRLLEVGTGSGAIANYFGTHASGKYEVDAVDVVDNRLVRDGFRYRQVLDVNLPFPDATFDVVLSNHVIEHVGYRPDQIAHLAELRRVMKQDAVGYLAVPNRWMLTEPHYQLRFLSWFPHRLRTPYLRFRNKGEYYDCEPLDMRELESMFREAGLEFQNICVQAMRETFAIERPDSNGSKILRMLPDGLLHIVRAAIPTLIYRFKVGKVSEG